jgi:hypothetical protein
MGGDADNLPSVGYIAPLSALVAARSDIYYLAAPPGRCLCLFLRHWPRLHWAQQSLLQAVTH